MPPLRDKDGAGGGFYASVPVFSSFASVADPAVYQRLPEDWVIGLADVVQSTAAIESGRYKAVNTAGAAVIAGVANALDGRDFPFVFGGDGASFAVSAADAPRAREALAATSAFVRDVLGLALRAAMVPVAKVRESRRDVRVARFAPSPDLAYAMFSGGGLALAEALMKEGAYAVDPAPAGTQPDLSGLSCRFAPITSACGVILSVIVAPGATASSSAFGDLVREVLALTESGAEAGRPIPEGGPEWRWPSGVDLEARTAPSRLPLALRRAGVLAKTLASYVIFRTGLRVGPFDPRRYRRQLVDNTDFRKFDDGLRLTIDCTPALAERIERRLATAEAEGIARYGTYRQSSALMTCFVPNPLRSDHVHFIDGAAGGYAAAARRLKGQA